MQTADLDSSCFENCPACKTDKHLTEKELSANQNCFFYINIRTYSE